MANSNRLLWWVAVYSLLGLALGLLLLAWAGYAPEKSAKELGSELYDRDVRVRQQAVRDLFERGPEARDAAEDLVVAFKDQDEYVQVKAQQTLVRIGKPAIPILIASLKDDDRSFRNQSMFVLVRMGADAVPALIVGLAMEDPRIHNNVVAVLTQIGRPAVLPLRNALRTHRNGWVRHRAAMALGLMGPVARTAVPTLQEALKDRSPEVRRASAQALGQIGKASRAAIPALSLARHDEDPSVARAAGEALERIRSGSPK